MSERARYLFVSSSGLPVRLRTDICASWPGAAVKLYCDKGLIIGVPAWIRNRQLRFCVNINDVQPGVRIAPDPLLVFRKRSVNRLVLSAARKEENSELLSKFLQLDQRTHSHPSGLRTRHSHPRTE